MKTKVANSLYHLIKELHHAKEQDKKQETIKVICDWDDVIQSYIPFIAWELTEKKIPFEEFHEQFWQEYKNHDEFKKKYEVTKEGESRTKYEKLKKDPHFYNRSPFLSPTEVLLTSLSENLIGELIFLTASDENLFPGGDKRKTEVFKNTFGHFTQAQLLFVPYLNGLTPTKGEWIKENHPDFDIFIDDRPDTIAEASKIFTPVKKMYALPDYGYNRLEGKNIYYFTTWVSSLKKEDLIWQEISKEKTNAQIIQEQFKLSGLPPKL